MFRLEGLRSVGHDVGGQDGWETKDFQCPEFIPWKLPWLPERGDNETDILRSMMAANR